MTISYLDRRRLSGFTLVGICLLAVLVRLLPGPWPVDDAYITFRYARNLAQGAGLVYNPGEWVLGTSTPLYTLLLALLARLGLGDLPVLAIGVNALADGATVGVYYRLARRAGQTTLMALLGGLVVAVYPISVRYAVGGMESALAGLLITLVAWLYLVDRPDASVIAAGLAVLIRPEALVLVGLIFAALLFERRTVPWRPLLLLMAVLLPWFLFAYLRYGSLASQSVLAKSHRVYQIEGWENLFQVFYHLGGLFWSGVAGVGAKGFLITPEPWLFFPLLLTALVCLVFWVIGSIDLVCADRKWGVIVAFSLIVPATFALAGYWGRLMAEWYLVPMTVFIFQPVFQGFQVVSRLAGNRTGQIFANGLILLFLSANMWGYLSSLDNGSTAWKPPTVWTAREELYREAAAYLQGVLTPDDLVAAPEIGALGYYCNCRILDTVGLVSPEALAYYPLPDEMYVINYAVPVDLIRDQHPDYLVSLDSFIQKSLLTSDWFMTAYMPIWSTPAPIFGSQMLTVYALVEKGAD